MGATHAAAYADIADACVVGVFSRDAARARWVAAICQAEPVSDPATLIEDPDIDAIDVCLPSALHRSVVIPALAAGKHVFCESPLAFALDDARQMRDAARRADRLLQVGLLMRSVSAHAHVKAATMSGAYGRLLSVATWRLGSYLHPDAPDHKAHYGDPSTELMTFDFDFIQWLMGRPHRLSASAVRTEQGGPGEISALLGYDGGRHATVMASGLMPPGSPFTAGFRALFERAVFEQQSIFEGGPPSSRFTLVEGRAAAHAVSVPDRNPYHVELQRFVDCIQDQADPALLDVERALEALILSEATQRALSEGHWIGSFTRP
ncbi:Gfo/Idh/MocA family oxidoreductase [soil metagenome]